MLQKVIKVGNSAAITIPKDFLKEAKIKIGDQVLVETDFDSRVVLMQPKKTYKKPLISKKFTAWTDKFINKYRSTLEELANK